MVTHHIGPILLREECIFRREIRFGEDIRINLLVTDFKPDFSRFSIRHEITKPGEVLAATIHADIAWIDTNAGKWSARPKRSLKCWKFFPIRIRYYRLTINEVWMLSRLATLYKKFIFRTVEGDLAA